MKRFEEVVKGQVEEVEVKRSKFEESSKSTPEFNPFLVEPVLVKLLKHVESVSELKELRKMCQLWDQVTVDELEDRAFNGKLIPVNFNWTSSIEDAKKDFGGFLEETQNIPRLFTSFSLNVSDHMKIFQNHTFFTDYHIFFLKLRIPQNMKDKNVPEPLKFILSRVGRILKGLKIDYFNYNQPPSDFIWPKSAPIHLPKLQNLAIQNLFPPILQVFESVVGGFPNLTFLNFGHLPNGNISPFLNAIKLTKLEICCIGVGVEKSLKITSGLITLAQNGMKLKDLELNLTSQSGDDFLKIIPKLPIICSNLTQFFATQSQTLENLKLNFFCSFAEDISYNYQNQYTIGEEFAAKCRIKLPIFEALNSLKLNIKFHLKVQNSKPHTQLFEMTQSPSRHFPKLTKLILDGESSLLSLCSDPNDLELEDEDQQLNIQYLEMSSDGLRLERNHLAALFSSIEEFKCNANLLSHLNIPWDVSLRHLSIKGVQNKLNLSHFKKLETLTIYDRKSLVHNQPDLDEFGRSSGRSYQNIHVYLGFFEEVTELDLTSIKFEGLYMSDESREEFIKYFPFPVQFTI